MDPEISFIAVDFHDVPYYGDRETVFIKEVKSEKWNFLRIFILNLGYNWRF
jgi:hypothetical protein